jgi:hypothetical protein
MPEKKKKKGELLTIEEAATQPKAAPIDTSTQAGIYAERNIPPNPSMGGAVVQDLMKIYGNQNRLTPEQEAQQALRTRSIQAVAEKLALEKEIKRQKQVTLSEQGVIQTPLQTPISNIEATGKFQEPFFSKAGQIERLKNVGAVLNAAFNPFSETKVEANVENRALKYGLEAFANHPYLASGIAAGGVTLLGGTTAGAITQGSITGTGGITNLLSKHALLKAALTLGGTVGFMKLQLSTSQSILTSSITDMNNIIDLVKKGEISLQQGQLMAIEAQGNILSAERSIKWITKNNVLNFLSGGKDTLTKFQYYRNIEENNPINGQLIKADLENKANLAKANYGI